MSIVTCSPGYSIVGRPKRQKSITDSPGPGAYKSDNKADKLKYPSYSIGNGKRRTLINPSEKIPGPGSYNSPLNTKPKAPNYIITGKNLPENSQYSNQVPGPGQYNQDEKVIQNSISKKYSFGVRCASTLQIKNTNPGPGNYDIRKNLDSKTCIFGTEKRDAIAGSPFRSLPGPGAYNPQHPDKVSPNGVKFPTSLRSKLGGDGTNPGPGAYSNKGIIGSEGSKITMVSRHSPENIRKDDINPGPAAYCPKKEVSIISPRGNKFGLAARSVLESKQGIPGPGQYLSDRYKGSINPNSGIKIGFAERGEEIKNFSPGPGAYKEKNTIGSGLKISMSSKLGNKGNINLSPGPGAYTPNLNSVLETKHAPGLGYGSRLSMDSVNGKNIPGPGHYTNLSKGGSPMIGFPTSERKDLKGGDYPGPGNYNIGTTVGVLPKYSNATSKIL